MKKKGKGGSRITGGVYVVLRERMESSYIKVPLNTSLNIWHTKWFYVKQAAVCVRAGVEEAPEHHPARGSVLHRNGPGGPVAELEVPRRLQLP